MSFQDFYKNMGFMEYPFAIFTSESEQARQKELFFDTSLYSPIVENFLSGNTIILSGDRGTGKTAILYDLVRRLQNTNALEHFPIKLVHT
jgi:Cdc6-like AAA superfamily ATPase